MTDFERSEKPRVPGTLGRQFSKSTATWMKRLFLEGYGHSSATGDFLQPLIDLCHRTGRAYTLEVRGRAPGEVPYHCMELLREVPEVPADATAGAAEVERRLAAVEDFQVIWTPSGGLWSVPQAPEPPAPRMG